MPPSSVCAFISLRLHALKICAPGEDAHFDPLQTKPHIPFVREFLSYATGKDKAGNTILTPADVSRFSAKRRADCMATNPDYTLDEFHKMFGSANSSTLLCIFGGRVDDLEPFLAEERIPEGWEPKVLMHSGVTFIVFNRTALEVEHGIQEDLPKITAAEATSKPVDGDASA